MARDEDLHARPTSVRARHVRTLPESLAGLGIELSRRAARPGRIVAEAGAVVQDSVILHGATIRAGATVERAIVDSRADVTAETIARSTNADQPTVIDGRGA